MKLNLGENIRKHRRRLDMTQDELADRLGVSFQSVSRWENGTTYPDMELLPEIADLFSVTVDALMQMLPIAGQLVPAARRDAARRRTGVAQFVDPEEREDRTVSKAYSLGFDDDIDSLER